MPSRLPILAALLAALPAAAQVPGFEPGEQIDLAVEFLGIRAGEARSSGTQ